MATALSHKEKLDCRVCSKNLLYRNYKRHLEEVHPEEDSSDLRGKGQKSLAKFFSAPQRPSCATERNNIEVSPGEAREYTAAPATQTQSKQNEADANANVIDSQNNIIDDQNNEENASKIVQPAPGVSGDSADKASKTGSKDLERLSKRFTKMKLDLHDLETDVSGIVNNPIKWENQLKENEKVNADEGQEQIQENHKNEMRKCRNIKELLDTFPLKYNRGREIMICSECVKIPDIDAKNEKTLKNVGVFLYKDNQVEGATKLTESFRNLKKHLLVHLLSDFHKEKVKVNLEIELKDPTTDEEKSIGMRIARICYYLYKRGKPLRDFEFLLLLHDLNDVKIGNINHNRMFAAKFLPFVASVIKERKIKFITSKMIQTGFRPPLAITADLATFRLKCRHFMATIACIPDSEKLMQVISLGQPPIGPRTGRDLADQIDDVVQEHHITPAQIPSTVTDGAYHHDHVQEYLEEKWEVETGEIHHAWDYMHKSALEDGHILKKSQFQWIEEVTDIVLECFRMFRVAKKYYLLVQVCERLAMKLAHPTTLPETRMANYKYVVLKNFAKDSRPIIVSLETIQKEKCDGNSRERQDADNAAVMRSKIYNRVFLLKLTGMCDVYDVYGHITNILQEVDVLPFEKFDTFEGLIKKFDGMIKTILVSDCPKCTPPVRECESLDMSNKTYLPVTQEEANFIPYEQEYQCHMDTTSSSLEVDQTNDDCDEGHSSDEEKAESNEDDDSSSDQDDGEIDNLLHLSIDRVSTKSSKVCLWPHYHSCLGELNSKGSYQGLKYYDNVDPIDGTFLDRTRSQQDSHKRRKSGDIIEKTNGLLLHFTKELQESLSDKTFSEQDTIMVEHSRKLTDFWEFYTQIQEMGPVWFCAQTFPSYLKSVRNLPVQDLSSIEDDEIRQQYRDFCRRLGNCHMGQDMKNSRDIIKHFLSTKYNLFQDIELIMHITLFAALKLPTESVLESKVSTFERHFHKGRPMKETTMIDEFEVATNGPCLVEADDILKVAMKKYWGGSNWHFVKKCDIRDYSSKHSKILKRLKREKSALPFMAK